MRQEFPRKVPGPEPSRDHMRAALRSLYGAFAGIGILSCVTNVLALTGSFFMLEVYDRVIPSRSVPTLVGLSLLAGFLYLFQGLLDAIRARLLVRSGLRVDECLHEAVHDGVVRSALQAPTSRAGLGALRDLDQLRAFFSGLGPTAFFDLPWVPLYIVICFMFHPLIGVTAICGAAVLVLITLVTEMVTRGPSRLATERSERRMALAETARRNAEAVHALGMMPQITAEWSRANNGYMASQRRLSDLSGALSGASRVFRLMLQSGMLALGAYLVIQQQATGGIMIASSILMSRALAPIELAIANWSGFVNARRSWSRLRDLLRQQRDQTEKLQLAAPCKTLILDHVSAASPGGERMIIRDVSLSLNAGDALGVIGPSGCGKSSLVRLMVGAWRPVGGKIRLDGATLDQWVPSFLGRSIGYLPQDVELLNGSVAKNIARFSPDATTEQILQAAELAGVHEMILALPHGYETEVGERGGLLSSGQRQRVALARALFGNPFLVVLDEPNSNLDAEGEQALSRAILCVRARGGIVVVVAHRPSALANIGSVLVMRDGMVEQIGERDVVMSRFMRPAQPVPVPDPAAVKPRAPVVVGLH